MHSLPFVTGGEALFTAEQSVRGDGITLWRGKFFRYNQTSIRGTQTPKP
jgi:hypothetical protein